VILPAGALVLLVGPPAAGKTTLAAALVAAREVAAEDVLSTDTYREALTGDALDLTSDRKVWVQVRERLVEKMAAGRTTVVDATNLFARRRARHVRVAREHGRPVVAIRFDVAAAELLERNETRRWVVRPNVVVTMAVEMEEHGGADALATEVDLVLDAGDVLRRPHTRVVVDDGRRFLDRTRGQYDVITIDPPALRHPEIGIGPVTDDRPTNEYFLLRSIRGFVGTLERAGR